MAMWSRALLALRPHCWAVLPLVLGVQIPISSVPVETQGEMPQ